MRPPNKDVGATEIRLSGWQESSARRLLNCADRGTTRLPPKHKILWFEACFGVTPCKTTLAVASADC